MELAGLVTAYDSLSVAALAHRGKRGKLGTGNLLIINNDWNVNVSV